MSHFIGKCLEDVDDETEIEIGSKHGCLFMVEGMRVCGSLLPGEGLAGCHKVWPVPRGGPAQQGRHNNFCEELNDCIEHKNKIILQGGHGPLYELSYIAKKSFS